jgi:hypothetical protein
MSDWGDLARRVIKVLETFLVATDRASVDPQGTVQELGDLLVKWARNSPETAALLTRFQEDPVNSDIQTALCGRLTEALLSSLELVKALQDKLAEADDCTRHPGSTFYQQGGVHVAGSSTITESVVNTGSGSIKHRTIKVGNIRLPLPVFALILLLGGGAVVGSGVAIVNANASPTSYSYYADDSGPGGYSLIYMRWSEYQGGSIDGEVDHYSSSGQIGVNEPVHFVGHQSDSSVDFNWTELGYSLAGHGSLQGERLTVSNLPHAQKLPEQLARTTSEQFAQILDQAKKVHRGGGVPGAGTPLRGAANPEFAVVSVYSSVAANEPALVCGSTLDAQQFVRDFNASSCEQAVSELSKKVTDRDAYAGTVVPVSAIHQDSPLVATVYSCAIKVEGGPSLGTFNLARGDNGWVIVGHAADPATCPAF